MTVIKWECTARSPIIPIYLDFLADQSRAQHVKFSPLANLSQFVEFSQSNRWLNSLAWEISIKFKVMFKLILVTWWHHQMETFSALLAIFVWGIHRSPVNSPHKCQWRRALMFSLICAWINSCVNNHEAGDLRCHRSHYDVRVMIDGWAMSCKNCHQMNVIGPYWW